MDADSVPDWWERLYIGSLLAGLADDPDSDGFSNWQELIAGTNPVDGRSALRLSCGLSQQSQTNVFVLRWASAQNRKYRICGAATPSGSYSLFISNIVATPPLNQMFLPLEAGPMFFRVFLEH